MAPCVTAAGEAPDGVSTIVFIAAICCVAFIIGIKEQQSIDLVSQSQFVECNYIGIRTSTNGQPVALTYFPNLTLFTFILCMCFPSWIVIQLVTSLIGFGHVNHQRETFRLEVYRIVATCLKLKFDTRVPAWLLNYCHTPHTHKTWPSMLTYIADPNYLTTGKNVIISANNTISEWYYQHELVHFTVRVSHGRMLTL